MWHGGRKWTQNEAKSEIKRLTEKWENAIRINLTLYNKMASGYGTTSPPSQTGFVKPKIDHYTNLYNAQKTTQLNVDKINQQLNDITIAYNRAFQ